MQCEVLCCAELRKSAEYTIIIENCLLPEEYGGHTEHASILYAEAFLDLALMQMTTVEGALSSR